jgi:hypothetical protein
MPRGTPQRGDFTGSERQRLTEEKAAELADRQQEIGLVNQVDVVREEQGIFDPETGQVMELSPEAEQRIRQLEEPVTVDTDPILDPAVPVPGYDPMRDLQPVGIQQQTRVMTRNPLEVEDLGPEPVTVEDEYRVIRVNTDIEDMTYGIGTSYTFLRGRRYRVSKHLYQWLESRGVIYH